MIVRLAATTAQIVTQVDHAVVSGQLAEAWGGDAVPALDPPDSVIAAARLHDIGWRHWEVEPRLNPDTGQPTNFLDVDIHEHLRLYRPASRRSPAPIPTPACWSRCTPPAFTPAATARSRR